MPVVNGDILRIVQESVNSYGHTIRSKFYLLAETPYVEPSGDVITAIESWLTDAYHEQRLWASNLLDLEDAIIDVIAWSGAWRTQAHIGVASPSNPYAGAGRPLVPDQVAGLITFRTACPSVRRPFYQWSPREDHVSGNTLSVSLTGILVAFAAAVLLPVVLQPASKLVPITVQARGSGVHKLTAVVVTDQVAVLSRRRPTA